MAKIMMVVFGVAMLLMGIQSGFFPRDGAEASMVSLFAAGGMGLIVLAMVWLSFKKPPIAYSITLLICLAAIGRFAPVVYSADKPAEGQTVADLTLEQQQKKLRIYPALVTVVLGGATALVLVGSHVAARKAKKSGD